MTIKELVDEYYKSSDFNMLAEKTKVDYSNCLSTMLNTKVSDVSIYITKVDKLTGLKENVIVGKLIPAGTGNVIRALRKEAKIRDNSLLKQIENTK